MKRAAQMVARFQLCSEFGHLRLEKVEVGDTHHDKNRGEKAVRGW